MQRREFVHKSLSAAAVLAIGGCGREQTEHSVPMTPTQTGPAIGVQLYTLRTVLEQDFEGTIRKIGQIGYREVELHNFFGRSASEVRAILDKAGLVAPARHVGLTDLRTRIADVIEESRIVGCRWVVCPGIDESERTLEGYRRVADDLSAVGAACRAEGLDFAYHNHDFEFAPVEDVIPYDLLLEVSDADLVKMELDIFWITKGGANPLAYFDRYPGRFPLCHVKDMSAGGDMVDVGTGIIDFATIFDAAEQAGLQHYFVEHDEPGDPISSVTTSYSGLRSVLAAD